jgi:phage repressor protein C with HTH and peptisase S24 domain
MLTHLQIWNAIDALAERQGLTPSGLARKAGLDSTTFNRSKRIGSDGRLRWPSTESIAKSLEATGETLDTFMDIIMVKGGGRACTSTLSMIDSALLKTMSGHRTFFGTHGFPAGDEWEEVTLPHGNERPTFVVELDDDQHMPMYRAGDRLIISSHGPLRRHDRVLILLHDGSLVTGELLRETTYTLTVHTFSQERSEQIYARDHIALCAQILWASQ